jgi:hypothetical protein
MGMGKWSRFRELRGLGGPRFLLGMKADSRFLDGAVPVAPGLLGMTGGWVRVGSAEVAFGFAQGGLSLRSG